MVVAADHVGDVHVMVVDHDGKIISRGAVAAQDHEVVEILVGKDDTPLDAVFDHRLALARRLEADRRRNAGRRLAMIPVTPSAVIAGSATLGAGALAHGGELLRARVAAIGLPFGKQLLRHLAVAFRARHLIEGLAVPLEVEPAQAVENGEDRSFRGARLVGVLDAQQHLAALGACVEPIEEGSPGAADMQIARGRGRKTRDDLFAHGSDVAMAALTRLVLHVEDDDLIFCLVHGVVDEIRIFSSYHLADAFSHLSPADFGTGQGFASFDRYRPEPAAQGLGCERGCSRQAL